MAPAPAPNPSAIAAESPARRAAADGALRGGPERKKDEHVVHSVSMKSASVVGERIYVARSLE